MVENRPLLNFVTHAVLLLGVALVALPIWITFVAATHDEVRMMQGPIPLRSPMRPVRSGMLASACAML